MKYIGLILSFIFSTFLFISYTTAKESVMQLTSTAFEPEGRIPDQYTCKGENKSPDLSWNNTPKGTRSLALIVDDPDAPGGTFTHWVAFNIPANQNFLAENNAIGFPQGRTSFGTLGYNGPCPPQGHGSHRYYFKLYALDTIFPAHPDIDKEQLLKAMEGHILDHTELMGTYEVK